ARFGVVKQRLVVASFNLPAINGAFADPLPTYRQAGHVIGCVDRKKQNKSQQIHADQDQHTVKQATNNIADHDGLAESGLLTTVARTRERAMPQARPPPTMASTATSHNGHHTGTFHALIFSARKLGAIR